ncbi:hypothetical protein KDK77_09815, partial [bacterium]|nr:hypothetical protein [bacterium]
IRQVGDLEQLYGQLQMPELPLVFAVTQSYFNFNGTLKEPAYKLVASNKADILLGSSFTNFRRLLMVERQRYLEGMNLDEIPASLAATDVESLWSVVNNANVPVQHQYYVFLRRLFGTNFIPDQIFEAVSSFDPNSSAEEYVSYTQQLQKLLDNYIGEMTVSLKRATQQLNNRGTIDYVVTYPNGEQVQLSVYEYRQLMARMEHYAGQIQVYFQPGQGLGIMLRDGEKAPKRLPYLVRMNDEAAFLNQVLVQGRKRSFDELMLDSPYQQSLSVSVGVGVADYGSVQAGTSPQANYIQQRENAMQVRVLYETIAAYIQQKQPDIWQSLTLNEQKGLAALLAIQNNVDVSWVNLISNIYNEDISLSMTRRVQDIFSEWTSNDSLDVFVNALFDLLVIMGQSEWQNLAPASKQAVFQTVLNKYGDELSDQKHRDSLEVFFAQREPQAAESAPVLTAQDIQFLWMISDQEVKSSGELGIIQNELKRFSSLIEMRERALDERQTELDTLKTTDLKPEIQQTITTEEAQIGYETFLLNQLRMSVQHASSVSVVQAVDDFNKEFSGMMRIDASREFINQNPDTIRALIEFLRQPLEFDEQAHPDIVKIQQLLDQYSSVRSLWNSGQQEQAIEQLQALIGQIAEFLGTTQFLSGQPSLAQFEYDLDLLKNYVDGTEQDIRQIELFGGIGLLHKELLRRVPANLYIPALLAVPGYIAGNIVPVAGVTDIVISLKTAEFEPRQFDIFDELNRNRYRDEGIVYDQQTIFINTDRIDPQSETFFESVADTFVDSYISTSRKISNEIDALERAGLPADLRMYQFGAEALEKSGAPIRLENGFQARDIVLSGDNFGYSIPVALPPHKFEQLRQNQLAMMRLVQTYITQASLFVSEQSDFETARDFLQEAGRLATNLQLFSPVLVNNILNTIKRDMDDVEAQLKLAQGEPPADSILLYGGRSDIFKQNPILTDTPTVRRLLDGAFNNLASGLGEDVARDVRNRFSIVIGARPRENIPVNVIYISAA